MPQIDSQELAEMLNIILHAAYHLSHAADRNARRLKTPRLEKRRAIDRLFRAVIGRPANDVEHEMIGTDCTYYGGW